MENGKGNGFLLENRRATQKNSAELESDTLEGSDMALTKIKLILFSSIKLAGYRNKEDRLLA